ncbi:MAG TPA: PDZ domain-containing protein [Verrucomicrobiae bacterium]|nr:PDZ domain-containing protein [Verrucomicrobiae bacterium]
MVIRRAQSRESHAQPPPQAPSFSALKSVQLIAGIGLTLLAGSARAAEAPAETPANVRAVVETAIDRMRPALVRIRVVFTEYHEGRELKTQAVGSGAIISKDGYIVTNHHVAGHAARLICTLWNREEIEAELIGTDPLTDISVIKLRPEQPREFVPAVFGDSSKMVVGDSVLAMGSPMALSQSVTLGIISNGEMIMPRMFGTMGRMRLDGEDVGALVRWIGHDAAIYGGNSGGPLVNLQGQIIGINEIRFGLSGAIPGNLARYVSGELIAHGKVKRSWLGLDVQPLFKHGTDEKGVLVSGVVKDSPAARAGLQGGDLLMRIGDQPTNVRYDEEMPDFMRLVTSLPIGKEVTLTALRGGKEMSFRLQPVERGEVNPPETELKQWGVTARNLSFLAAREMKRTNELGVLVTSVRPGGPAGESKPALEPHDVITGINGSPIEHVEDLVALTRKLTDGRTEPTPVIATFERDSQRYLTVIKVGIQELRDPGLEVTKAWLPVETHVISRDIAQQLGRPDLKGFYVTEVYAHSTAKEAGLKPGDFITGVDTEKLNATGPEDEEELAALIRQYDIGTKVQLTIQRGTEQLKIPVELVRSPKLKREMKKYRNEDFEFTARDVAFFDRAEEQWPDEQRGAVVEDVKSGSWAELGSLYVDDLIVEVNGQPVKDVDSLKKIMAEIAETKRPTVVIKVLRGIHSAYLELEPAWKK